MAPRAAAGASPKRTTGGPQTGGRPHPAAGPRGGPRRGRSGKAQAGHGRRPGRQPHAQAAAASGRATAPRQSAPAGGLRPPAPRRPATRPDAGRPRAGAGQGRAAAMGRGRPGRASTGPACTRPAAYLLRPRPPPLGAGGDNRHGGGPGRRALCARDSGRAEGPRGGRIRSRGHPSRSWGGVGGKKNAGRLAPPAGHDWTKKNAGRTLCPPRLPLQRIPDIPLFGVVVRNVLDAGQFHMLL